MSLTSTAFEPTAPADEPTLIKRDRPRAIDQYIDFFGDPAAAGADPCGDTMLDALVERLGRP